MTARAALEAARAVFELSAGRAPTGATTAPVWNATDAPWATPRQRADAMWSAVEKTLQAVVGASTTSGHDLIAAARRLDGLTLDDAHALVSLLGWTEQIHNPDPEANSEHLDVEQPPSAFEKRIASEVWVALEHAVAQQPATSHTSSTVSAVEREATVPVPSAYSPVPPTNTTDRAWYMSPGMILLILALVIAAPAGVWWFVGARQTHNVRDGIAAYDRGAPEVARMALTVAVQEHPDDPLPLIYLGRIDREARDYASAKQFLSQAIQLQPTNALALREMASTLLAEGQPELARRFYVRTLENDPTDRLAQGFLACALHQSGREEESVRWAVRAGPGEWTACLGQQPDSTFR